MTSDISDFTIDKLWKSRNIILEILQDRKYIIPKSNYIDFDTFVQTIVNNNDEVIVRKNMMLTFCKKIDQDKIGVIWPHEPKLGTNIRDISLFLESLEIKRAIIVVNDSITSWGAAFIKNLKANKIFIDIYTLAETQFNITKHYLVPMHRLCTKLEKKRIMIAYSIEKDKLPQIRQCDPIVRHFGAVRGDLFKIFRESETQKGKHSISYRIVY
jgi:DNA-directed RNA polymerase subunit H (RpoH/RPB5)